MALWNISLTASACSGLISILSFREIEFTSSLTNKRYYGGTGEDGTLKITDTETGIEIPNNAKPSKKAIIGQAILDLGGETSKDETLYQRYRKLTKLILSK